MVSPVAAANMPSIVMTAIAVPAMMAVAMAMPVAAPDLDDGLILSRQRRHSQPRRSRADERQCHQRHGCRDPLNIFHRNIPSSAGLRLSQSAQRTSLFRPGSFAVARGSGSLPRLIPVPAELVAVLIFDTGLHTRARPDVIIIAAFPPVWRSGDPYPYRGPRSASSSSRRQLGKQHSSPIAGTRRSAFELADACAAARTQHLPRADQFRAGEKLIRIEDREVPRLLTVNGFLKSFGSKATLQQFPDCRGPARHPLAKTPRVDRA
jgi:hypothetical protein